MYIYGAAAAVSNKNWFVSEMWDLNCSAVNVNSDRQPQAQQGISSLFALL